MHTTALAFSLKALCALALVVLFGISGLAQSERILHSFAPGGSDGFVPYGGLTIDSGGNLYGTTLEGGTADGGTVFEMILGPAGAWTEQVLYNLGSNYPNDGTYPYGGVVFDGKGNLYGTTRFGISASGSVFQLTRGANGTWTDNTLYVFGGGSDGNEPYAGVTLDSAGNIYGTTYSGGKYGFGTVFELVAGPNGTWTEKVLHSFTGGNDGANPYEITLILDAEGNVYGVTQQGGAHDYGVVFELDHTTWAEKVLYAFTGAATGLGPVAGLVFDGVGNLYGVSQYSVFELSPGPNGTWTERSLHDFAGGSDGAYPAAPLIFDKAGNLYGTTYSGDHHRGTVFELKLGKDGVWTEKLLHDFEPSGGDGIFPEFGALVLDASGNLYGTTQSGGTSAGVVFEVTP
jgi:uncharacterized repeat protein (TIGR03803 family)